MDSTHYCKHQRIQRNCYSCHQEYLSGEKEKTTMDTLHEKISELMVRVSKLEEYKRHQHDINIEQVKANDMFCDSVHDVEKDIKNLNDFQSVINERWGTCVEHKNKQIDESRAVSKHLDDLDNFTRTQIDNNHHFSKQIDRFDEEIKNLDESYQGLSAELRHLLDQSRNTEKWFLKLDSWRDSINSDNAELNARQNDIEFKYACVPKNIEAMVKINFDGLNERIEKLEELSKERAHLINYKSYLDLVDRIGIIEQELVDIKIYSHPMQEKV